MRDPKRQKEIIKLLEKKWAKHPKLRFGQWLSNFLYGEDMFYIEDETLLALLKLSEK